MRHRSSSEHFLGLEIVLNDGADEPEEPAIVAPLICPKAAPRPWHRERRAENRIARRCRFRELLPFIMPLDGDIAENVSRKFGDDDRR